MDSFEQLGVSPSICSALAAHGIDVPTRVQVESYAPIRQGRDLLVQSQTGSGKTFAFAIPVAESLNWDGPNPQVLVLAPTRELAQQVEREFERLSSEELPFQTVSVVGGASADKQRAKLQGGAHIVCGTPGRVLDMIKRKDLVTDSLTHLVLDECDEMLGMGFADEIDAILTRLPSVGERQTLLFSATVPPEIERIIKRQLKDPIELELSSDSISAKEIDHFHYMLSGASRTKSFLHVLLNEKPDSAIIFCNRKDETELVANYLKRNGLKAASISSNLTQAKREKVLKAIREKSISFLVATDIAARGIDISGLTHVFNYSFPEDPAGYVHRTGRTGRAGKSGRAISLIGAMDLGSFRQIRQRYDIEIQERSLPDVGKLKELQMEQLKTALSDKLNEQSGHRHAELAEWLLKDIDANKALIAKMIEAVLEGPAIQPEPSTSDSKPKRPRGEGNDGKRRRRRRRSSTHSGNK